MSTEASNLLVAAKQALEALEKLTDTEQTYDALDLGDRAIASLRQAIEQAEKQEPYWLIAPNGEHYKNPSHPMNRDTPQPQREYPQAERAAWVGLTPADFDNLEQLFGNKVSNDFVFADIVCVISAKLKAKNGFDSTEKNT
jgi:hypothetical protein